MSPCDGMKVCGCGCVGVRGERKREREALMGFRLLQIIDVHLFLGHLVKERKKKECRVRFDSRTIIVSNRISLGSGSSD